MRGWLLLALTPIIGCKASSPTQVVVAIATDLKIGDEIDELLFRADSDARTFDQRYPLSVKHEEGKLTLPATIALLAADGGTDPVLITVTANKGDEVVVRRQARVSWATGRVALLRLMLLRGCARRPCTEGSTTCVDGRCQPIDVDASSLPPFVEQEALQDEGLARVLVDPEGRCSPVNACWFSSGCPDDPASAKVLAYAIEGLAPGTYRMSVYVMNPNEQSRQQEIEVCVGDEHCAKEAVGEHHHGIYERFTVEVTADEAIEVTHRCTAGANAVVQGVFFDRAADDGCDGDSRVCFDSTDDTTSGYWPARYGTGGYLLFNREPGKILAKGCADDPAAGVLSGGFGEAKVSVTPLPTGGIGSWVWGGRTTDICSAASAGPDAGIDSQPSDAAVDAMTPDADAADAATGCQHPAVVSDCTDGWCLIPAGCFYMGSPEDEPCRRDDETQHQVTLTRDFEVEQTEVTQGAFFALLGYNPSTHTPCGTDCPVETVSWHEAAAYCNELSSSKNLTQCYSCSGSGPQVTCAEAAAYTGKKIHDCPGYRLPTEAEWEYANRAGTTTTYYSGANDANGCEYCYTDANLEPIGWYCGNSAVTYTGCSNRSSNGGSACAGPHPVAQKAPNGWDLHDMTGNVWEWCHDWYDAPDSTPATDPWGASYGSNRVLKGGGWYQAAGWSRAAYRRHDDLPTLQGAAVGFRCARTR